MVLEKEEKEDNRGKVVTMVKVICGMIGSGKTTYAINNKK